LNHSPELPSGMPAVALVDGAASGVVLTLSEPLNAWGGLDPASGQIVDTRHPQAGALVRGRVLVLPEARGSGTNAQVFAQAIVTGNGPVAVVLLRPDFVLCVGAIVAAELVPEAATVPVVALSGKDFSTLHTGQRALVRSGPDGASVTISASSAG
jgi:predicted aconitase with swiveling domain